MQNLNHLESGVKLVKIGNSYAFPVSKKNCELLHADGNTQFEKMISEDGTAITFRKVIPSHSNILETANKLYNQHTDLMKRLENL